MNSFSNDPQMLKCVYTTDKVKKKKKWFDGFLDRRGSSIVLYNEEMKILTTSKFKLLEDDSIEASIYLVFPDNHDEFIAKFENIEEKNVCPILEESEFQKNNNLNRHYLKNQPGNEIKDDDFSHLILKNNKSFDLSYPPIFKGVCNQIEVGEMIPNFCDDDLKSNDYKRQKTNQEYEILESESYERVQGRTSKEILNLFVKDGENS